MSYGLTYFTHKLIKMNKRMLDLAVAQFTGYSQAEKHGNRILDLVYSMGLTKQEWADIKGDVEFLGAKNIQEIDDHFSKT